MESKQTLSRTSIDISVLEDSDYYKYIFKKTEKIACAVFYILRSTSKIRHDDMVVHDLEKSAKDILDISLRSLRSTRGTVEEHATDLRFALIEFESRLRVTNAAHILNSDLLEVFLHEIDSILRLLKKYTQPTIVNPLTEETIEGVTSHTAVRRPARGKEEHILPSRIGSQANVSSRKERVLNVIRDKGEATIKDITDIVMDCSEKTIQRELIGLIKDNIVLREGERRWSKYKLV